MTPLNVGSRQQWLEARIELLKKRPANTIFAMACRIRHEKRPASARSRKTTRATSTTRTLSMVVVSRR